MNALEELERQQVPFARTLGIRLTAADPQRVCGEMLVRDDLCTSPAVLHGGALMALADSLGAYATVLNLPAGAGTTTLESKTNFLAPAPVGTTVVGECTPIIAGSARWSGRPESSVPMVACSRS